MYLHLDTGEIYNSQTDLITALGKIKDPWAKFNLQRHLNGKTETWAGQHIIDLSKTTEMTPDLDERQFLAKAITDLNLP